MYAFRTTLGPVELAFTDRHGGVSGVPFASLNLASSAGDDPDAVRRNLDLLLGDFTGAPPQDCVVADLNQVHGRDVVDAHARAEGEARPRGDALVADRPGVVLLVRAADCVPVLLADPEVGIVGAAHSGRQGTALGVVPAVVARMRDLGARHLTAWIGPHVCGACYEVPAALREEVAEVVPAAHATTSWGTPALDLGAGVRAQLLEAGIGAEGGVVAAGGCTRESPDLFSYRRDGVRSGRLAGLITIRADASLDDPGAEVLAS